MKFYFTACFLFLFFCATQAQSYHFWVEFTDKGSAFNINQPEAFLTDRSISRRLNQQIEITDTDLPVNAEYLIRIASAGHTIQNSSKWLNGAVIYTTDSIGLSNYKDSAFVQSVELVGYHTGLKSHQKSKWFSTTQDVGSSTHLDQLNANDIHTRGYRGRGMLIGVIDGGFKNANTLGGLSHLFDQDQVVSFKNFNDPPGFIADYSQHPHGTNVLSLMAGYVPGELEGVSLESDYVLCVSEKAAYEQPVELYNWISAVEYCDSLGVAVINTSLGYNVFESGFESFEYADLNGATLVSSMATLAARKGILMVISIGNEGTRSWRQLMTPGDADSVLTVGAVDEDGLAASFSSYGPSADGRIKPDVVALGVQNQILSIDNEVVSGSGTSYSSPIMAGLSACLWQAFPDASNMEILNAIRQSAHLYDSPEDQLGYGVPDFDKAFVMLESKYDASDVATSVQAYVQDNNLYLEINGSAIEWTNVQIYSILGQMLGQLMIEDFQTNRQLQFNIEHMIGDHRAVILNIQSENTHQTGIVSINF